MDYRRPRRFDGSTLAPDLGMSSCKHAVRRTCPSPIPILQKTAVKPTPFRGGISGARRPLGACGSFPVR